MHAASLELIDFRNYTRLELYPAQGLNLFVGQNGQGKSNILESLYILATTKSTRASRDSDMIRFEAESCHARIEAVRQVREDIEVELVIGHHEKKFGRLNSMRHSRMTDIIGQLNAVLFASGDLEIILGEPSVRRRFLDLEISQTSPRYVHSLATFRRALDQRNRLLKEIRDARAGIESRETLPAWTEQVVTSGSVLIERRHGFLKRLNEIAVAVHSALCGGADDLLISYVPSVAIDESDDVEGIKIKYHESLNRSEREELVRGNTAYGPQRDDVQFMVNGQECRMYSSQGQQRTVTLAVKLAERQLIQEMVGEAPLLLLDDVLSDLDDMRRSHLFQLIAESGSQTFLTCTNLRAFDKDILNESANFRVSAGHVTRQ